MFETMLLARLCVSCWEATVGIEQAGNRARLETIAEMSNFTATSRHADVVDFCEKLAKRSPVVRLAEMGVSHEGRKIPLVILADPPVATAAEAAESGKLVVFAMGNIHAGEVDGKEALLMLARDLALAGERPLLKDLILVFCPNFNPDGGDRLGKNRPHQAGPSEVGIRANAQGFDLNRDFVKLETPEVQALVRFLRHWDPALVIDCHTTNGTSTRYTLTYDAPRHPANDAPLLRFAHETLLIEAGRRLEKATGFKSFVYGNLTGGTAWKGIEGQPRYSTHYVGFRNRIGILSESYVYAPYRDRVLASREFVRGCCEVAAAHKDQLRRLLRDADRADRDAPPGARVALRHKLTSQPDKATVLVLEGGKTAATGKPRDLRVDVMSRAEATLSAGRPHAYLFPASFAKAVENLQRHGIAVEELRQAVALDVEVYRIDKLTVAKPFQKHNLVSIEATARKENRQLSAGTIVVRTNQRLGNLAAFLLEPQSEDGLCTWNFFDAGLAEGGDYPVVRLAGSAMPPTSPTRPLPEDHSGRGQ